MNKIDILCDRVNEKYNLRRHQAGSVERYQDMWETSVVQVCNQFGGVRTLLSGDEKTLTKYLQNILDDKTILNFWAI